MTEPVEHQDRDQEDEFTWAEIFDLQDQTFKELMSRVEALEKAAPAPGAASAAYCWRELTDPKDREDLWNTLRSWVDWISVRYLAHGATRIPSCWYRHPVAVEELTALWAGWYFAYHQKKSPNMLAIDWHQRYFWPTLKHLGDKIYKGCIETREHIQSRINPYVTDDGFEEFATFDATWAQNPPGA